MSISTRSVSALAVTPFAAGIAVAASPTLNIIAHADTTDNQVLLNIKNTIAITDQNGHVYHDQVKFSGYHVGDKVKLSDLPSYNNDYANLVDQIHGDFGVVVDGNQEVTIAPNGGTINIAGHNEGTGQADLATFHVQYEDADGNQLSFTGEGRGYPGTDGSNNFMIPAGYKVLPGQNLITPKDGGTLIVKIVPDGTQGNQSNNHDDNSESDTSKTMYDFNIKIVDENNQQVGSATGQASAAGLSMNPTDLGIPAGYKLAGGQSIVTPAKGQDLTVHVVSDGTPKAGTIHYQVTYVDQDGHQVATGNGYATNALPGQPITKIKAPDGYSINAGQNFKLPEDGGTVTVHVTKQDNTSDEGHHDSNDHDKANPDDHDSKNPTTPSQEMYTFNIKVVDEQGKEVATGTGQASQAGFTLDPAKLNIPAGYKLVDGQHLTTPAKGQTVTIRVMSDGTPKPMTIHYTVKYVDANGQQVATGSGYATNAHKGDPLLGIKVPDGFTIDAGQSLTLPDNGGTVTVHVTKLGGSKDNHNNQPENPDKDKPTNPGKDDQDNQSVKPGQDKKDDGQNTDPSDNNDGHQISHLPDNKGNDAQSTTKPGKDHGSDNQKQPSTDTNDYAGHSTQPGHQEATTNKRQQGGINSNSSEQKGNPHRIVPAVKVSLVSKLIMLRANLVIQLHPQDPIQWYQVQLTVRLMEHKLPMLHYHKQVILKHLRQCQLLESISLL